VNAFRAELLKARTTRLLVWYGAGLAGFLVLVVSIHVGSDDRLDLATHSTQRSLMAVAGLSAVLAVLVGSVLVATEYNHGTINQSLLAVPDRLRLLAAKLGCAALVGALLAVLAGVLLLVLAEVWYAARGIDLHLGNGTIAPLLGTIAAGALAAVIGQALGAILRRQTATIVIVLLWLLIGENIVSISPHAARYAPGHVIAAVVSAHSHGTHDTLAFWPALAVGVVYAAVLWIAGALVVLGSDVPSTGE
jgi:ABC-2 type transport system permease protein